MPDTNHPPSPSQIPGHSRSNGGVLAVVALLLVPFVGDVRPALGALSASGWRDFLYLAVAGFAAQMLVIWMSRAVSLARQPEMACD